MFFWLGTLLLVPSIIGGLGLLLHKRWARVVIIIVSVEFLLGFPVFTALGVYGLWALLSKETEPLFVVRRPRPEGQNGIWLAMLCVAVAFVVVIGGGLALSRYSAIPTKGPFGLVAALALVAIAFGLARLLGIPKQERKVVGRQEVRSTPVAAAQGVRCVHLERFEQTMRAVGIGFSGSKAECRVNRRALERIYAPLGPVSYREYFEAERAPEDIPIAVLYCSQCSSALYTLHPVDSHVITPWFPDAPRPLKLVAQRPFASRTELTAIAPSPSGRLAAIAVKDAAIWDSARVEPVIQLPGHGVIRRVAWSADERLLVTGRGVLWSGGPGEPGVSVFVWDASTGRLLTSFAADLFGVRGIALSPDGRLLLASGMSGKTPAEGSTLDVWEMGSGRLVTRLAQVTDRTHHNIPYFTSVAFTPDGTLALAGCDLYLLPPTMREKELEKAPWWWGRGVRAWRLSDGQEIDLIRHYTQVRTISVSRDGSRLFAAGTRFGMWRLTDGAMVWDKQNWRDNAIAASADCGLVARGIGCQIDNHGPFVDTAVELYDGSNGEFLTSGLHARTPTAVAFSGNGGAIIAGGVEGELLFWNWTPDYGS